MVEHDSLKQLRFKLFNDLKEKESVIKELQEKISAIDRVLGLLSEEGYATPELPLSFKREPGRYKDFGLQEAILDCFKQEPLKSWSVVEVRRVLNEGGLQTKAKNMYAIVSATLDRLATKGKITVEKTKKGRRFRSIDTILQK